MKKFYRISIFLIIFIILSTYSPKKVDLNTKNSTFFKVQKIIVLNNLLLKKSDINLKLNQVYNKNIFLIKKEDIVDSLNDIDFLEKVEVKKKVSKYNNS